LSYDDNQAAAGCYGHDTPEEEQPDYVLYVDFKILPPSFATILSEARKYRLDLTIAHQYIEQLGRWASGVRNVNTIITALAQKMPSSWRLSSIHFYPRNLVSLPNTTFT
jgi:hypothetical protein